MYRANGEDLSFLAYWIVAGSISTLYAYSFDIVYDWNLIQNCCCFGDGRVMRKKRVFGYGSKKIYVFFMVINFILRVAWLFTISSDFVISVFSYPYVFIMVVSILEICRRGIWNLVFIEKEHVQHC